MLKIGDRVEYIQNIEWGPFVGEKGEVIHIYTDGALLIQIDGSTQAYVTHRREVRPIIG